IEEADAAAFPEPPGIDPGIERSPHPAGHGGEEPLRQAPPRLAIGSGLRAAWLEPSRDTVRDQSGHRSAAGLVGGEDLAEEDPEGHQRREDPIIPTNLDLSDSLFESLRRENIGKWESALVEELLPEKAELLPKTSVQKVSHRAGSEPVKELYRLPQ